MKSGKPLIGLILWGLVVILCCLITMCAAGFVGKSGHGDKATVYRMDPDVLADHLKRFGENRYMTKNELRRAKLVETEPGHRKPLLSEEICSIAAWYNEKRFLWEILEDFCRFRDDRRRERQ
jgi:hypothetical protein